MSAAPEPQTSIYETTLDDPDLEEALEERQKLKDAFSTARALYEEANEKAKGRLGDIDLGMDAPVRVGRFLVTRRMSKPRAVSFETNSKVQLRIAVLDEDA